MLGRQQTQLFCLQKGKIYCVFRDSNTGSSCLSLVSTLTVLCRLQIEKWAVFNDVFWTEETYSYEAKRHIITWVKEMFIACGK